MRQIGISILCMCGLLAAAAFGQQAKPNFSGNWRLMADKSQIHAGKAAIVNLSIEQKGTSIHIVKTIRDADGKETTAEYTCTTDGADCDARGYKVSMFFDGPALIEMDFTDTAVTKTTLTLDDNRTICAGITYISPKSEADALFFDKR